jgi:hypothetical protein
MWLTNMKAALAACKDDIFPLGAMDNWWITASNPFTRMLAILFTPTPRVKQNAELFVMLLHCSRMLKAGRGLRSDSEEDEGTDCEDGDSDTCLVKADRI